MTMTRMILMTVFGTYMRLIYKKRWVLLTRYDTDVSDDDGDGDEDDD
jgi:hypothetical protein